MTPIKTKLIYLSVALIVALIVVILFFLWWNNIFIKIFTSVDPISIF